ncbi:GlcNAc-PI de-N-acetylase [Micromonospora rhizosphaerae]|uniref:GlcNAc-PI de-N-acetylase n=1 Tax=Micromonospora rhizosphaerae TaxID=568872 RepID=A0A1C6RYR9_9ACTN|nr:PIG-L family deacetylase [Micromonospora rhizosphaerae]SCL22373.1 GlcNAc-PI de-N-acetylase [Micromonospora rhizosphaerae]
MPDHLEWVEPVLALARRAARLPRGARTPFAPVGRPRSMAVMAHQDDDLYFLNPLLVSQLHSSEEHLTVCLTAGEGDGRNAPGGTREHAAAPVDFEAFAAARFNGLRCAYADMVLGDRDAKWRREVTTLAGGAEADVSVLVDAPHVRLVALNLWCAPPPDAAPGSGPLTRLWTGEATSTPTMVPLGSPVTGTHSYSRDSLVESLVELMRRFEPTLLWTMDPDPDLQVHDRANPRYADTGDYSDHIFHTITGLFAHEAAARWFAEGGGRRTSVEAFRGYYVRRWPSNLSPEARARKQRYKDVYGWADRRPSGDPAGLGDRKVGGDLIAGGNASGTTLRYPGSRSWAGPGADGRLSAFAVRGGQVVHWREDRPGEFAGSRRVPGRKLLPHVDAVPTADGGWRLFAVRQGLTADPAQHVRDLWTILLPASGDYRDVRWESLGNPNAQSGPAKRRNIGMPQAVSLPGGRLLVLTRNAGKGLSGRLHDGATWTPWRDLGGGDTQEGLTAVALDDGSVEVLAAGRNGIARWLVSTAGELTAKFSVVRTEAPAGPPTVVRLPDGSRMMFCRCRDSASVVSFRTRGDGQVWDPSSLVDLGGHGGPGPIAARFVPDRREVLVAVRDDASATSVLRVGPDGRARGTWLREATPVAGSHAVSVDSSGRPVVLAVSAGGGLLTLPVTPSTSSVSSMKEVP